ncbi:MAG: hypothetical protein V3V00_06100 [Saprospiraceae bacterium]
MQKLIIIGGGTAFYEICGIIRSINNKVNPSYEVVGILDDDASLIGKKLNDIPIIGTLQQASTFSNECKFVFAIGSMNTRLERENILNKTGLEKKCFETLIHPNSDIDISATIGFGCIIHFGVVVGNHAVLDGFNIIAVNSAIGPYVQLHEYSMITSLCLILTNSKVGKFCFIGSSSTITENVTIGKGSFVGVGSIVTRSLKEGSFGMGNPFRILKVDKINI